jgi:hypothetical protein
MPTKSKGPTVKREGPKFEAAVQKMLKATVETCPRPRGRAEPNFTCSSNRRSHSPPDTVD